MEDRDFLEHHGIKGQKWGVRRTPEQLGRRIKSGASKVKNLLSKKKSEKSKSTRSKPKRISAKKMSDEELRKRIERLELEQRYKNLSKSTRSRGKNLVLDILESSGKNIGTQLTTYQMGKFVNSVFKKEIVNPKKGQKDK